MSLILKNNPDFTDTENKPDENGFIQTLPPENSMPTSWMANEYRIWSNKRKSGEITDWQNLKGQLTHYTERVEQEDGTKDIIQWTYFQKTFADGKTAGFWKRKGWKGPKHFHNCKKVKKEAKPILVVEGEKVLHFASNHSFLKDLYFTTTWYGGAENAIHFDVECFKNKQVILCPDNDEMGMKAAYKIIYNLLKHNITTNIKIFQLAQISTKLGSSAFKIGWDIADPFPKGYSIEETLKPDSFHIQDFKNVRDQKLWKETEDAAKETESKIRAKKHLTDWCWVMSNDSFNKMGTNDFVNSRQIDNMYKHETNKTRLSELLLKDPNFKKAETFITSAKYPPGIIEIKGPNEIPLVVGPAKVLNIYVPNYIIPKKGNGEAVKKVRDYFYKAIGPKFNIIEQWIAYQLRFPGEKIKFANVIVSAVEGIGKGLLARLCSRLFGFHNVNENANYKHLTNTHNTLLIGTQICVLNEVSMGDFKSKSEGTNALKNFIGDDYYTCNFKGKPMVKLPNLTNFVIFSNDERVVSAPSAGRRYFFVKSQMTEKEVIKITSEGVFDVLWKIVDSDEAAAELLYYYKNEIELPDPTIFKKRAPITEDLLELVEQSKHPLQKKLEYDLKIAQQKIFNYDFCGIISFEELNEKLSNSSFNWGSYGDDAIYKFLSDNCIAWHSGSNTRQLDRNGVKVRHYLLDDSKCPIPGKSYKDLTPKQIVQCINHYTTIIRCKHNEEKEYHEAVKTFPATFQALKNEAYKNNINAPEEVIKGWLNGKPPIDKWTNSLVQKYHKEKKIIDRGIRTIQQIIDDPHFCNEDSSKTNQPSIKHHEADF